MGKRAGRPFRSWRTSPEKAWKYPELEYGNAGSSIAALVLDCDKPRAMACGLFELPPPNWIVRRPANNHAHVAWTLAEPVHRYPAARVDPLRYFAGIAEYFAFATDADASYAGVLAHNPACRPKSPYKTTWGGMGPYTLDQLARVIRSIGSRLLSGRQALAGTSICSRPGCAGPVGGQTSICRCCLR